MPSSYDARPVAVTNNPTQRLDLSLGNTGDLDPLAFLDQIVSLFTDYLAPVIKDFTGVDLSSPEAFFTSIVTMIAGGGAAALAFVQAIVQGVVDFIFNGLTGGTGIGNPLEALTPLLSGLAGLAQTAMNSANQATDIARQLAALVVQTVQGLDNVPVFGDIFEMVNSFAFWFLGLFGITQQSVTDSNPAVAGVLGRVAALESSGTPGLEGFADHFNRPAIGPDWVTITPYNDLNIESSQWLKSYNHCAGRYDAELLLTENWHVQFSLAHLDYGQSRFCVSTNGTTAESSFTNGLLFDVAFQWYGTTITVYSMTGGLFSGTQQAQRAWDAGVVKVGDVLAVEYIEADNTFYTYLNNVEVPELRFLDSSNLVDHGVGNRGIAVLTNLADNSQFSGPGFDDMSAYDIKVT